MKERTGRFCRTCVLLLVHVFAIILSLGAVNAVRADDRSDAQATVDKANGALGDLMGDSMFSWLKGYLKDAKGVLIFPELVKGGFFLGGSGGNGVFMVRDKSTGAWSYPAFYTIGSLTFGLQIGGESAEVVMLAMNQKAVNTLLSSSVKLGGDVSIAAGPLGGGAKGSLGVPEVTTDFISFSKPKGLYAGLNLEGSVLAVRGGLNRAYYGGGTLPIDILIGRTVGNPGADGLRTGLENASGKEIPAPVPPERGQTSTPPL